MNDRDFSHWLWGFFELSNPKTLSEEQTKQIKENLQLVFNKVPSTTTSNIIRNEHIDTSKFAFSSLYDSRAPTII